MLIGIEICLVIVLSIAGWLYLELEGADNKKEAIRNGDRKKKIFGGIMCVLGIVMVFGLNHIFPENHYLANIKLLTLVTLLFPIAWKDYTNMIIPNKIIGTGLIIRLVYYVLELILRSESFFTILKQDLFALVIVIVFLIVGTFIIKNGIGMGDIKLLILISLFQGIYGMFSSIFFSLFAAFITGIFLLVTKRKGKKDSIPFAPSILIGTYISVFLTGV
ncbi:leader peptidase (prepilin peptidase)/N-methyltransferase [Mobilisporobacter senegalensis]|uniref:Leader peptidase (Prepilin peptidase)/N-methyltransferase n=1 Tax=Mobilisporobacter senegalensis TaxID=1329262 RepID=A0A3N1XPS4_9FIRM|nr:A24 family peptidase [Mobilisporobacter senegalensis]ROR28679.1 leader peptidase (prepilin peptidase)/N-methyltransferase [Mobilisporobacter senegalensis]